MNSSAAAGRFEDCSSCVKNGNISISMASLHVNLQELHVSEKCLGFGFRRLYLVACI